MATNFLSVTHGNGPRSAANISSVVQGTSTVATASVQVEINNTVAPNLGYDDVVDALLAFLNYVRTDKNLPPASRVLNLRIP